MVFGKSPCTKGWGDANCGGYFGPKLKAAGLDGILFRRMSGMPVYLLVEADPERMRRVRKKRMRRARWRE